MSRETGGRCLEVSKSLSIEQIFKDIQDELRSQYNLGFVSDVPVRISEFRKLQLTTKAKRPRSPIPDEILGEALAGACTRCALRR